MCVSRYYCNSAVFSHFRHHSVSFSFIKLRLYTKERIPNRMSLVACLKSKYFKFYRILNCRRIGYGCLVSSFFRLSPSNYSSPNFWQFSNCAISMKLGMQLPNKLTFSWGSLWPGERISPPFSLRVVRGDYTGTS